MESALSNVGLPSQSVSATETRQLTSIPLNIEEFGKELRKCITGSANGPLIMASKVMRLADNWQAFRGESGGLSCHQWLQGICGAGKGLAWWMMRDRAVLVIGESCRRTLDHEVAVFVSRNVPREKIDSVLRLLIGAMKENGGNPLSLKQAKIRIAKALGKSPTKKDCACCRRYEELLKAHGIDPNEQMN